MSHIPVCLLRGSASPQSIIAVFQNEIFFTPQLKIVDLRCGLLFFDVIFPESAARDFYEIDVPMGLSLALLYDILRIKHDSTPHKAFAIN